MMPSPKVKIIVAYDENMVIGHRGDLPWHFPEDLKHFKKETLGCPVIMGFNTWESIYRRGRGPLPGRMNIVVSRNWFGDKPRKLDRALGHKAGDLREAIEVARVWEPKRDAYIIGGEQIYRAALGEDLVDEVVASLIKGKHEGDAFFPKLPWNKWIQELERTFAEFSIVRFHRAKNSLTYSSPDNAQQNACNDA